MMSRYKIKICEVFCTEPLNCATTFIKTGSLLWGADRIELSKDLSLFKNHLSVYIDISNIQTY